MFFFYHSYQVKKKEEKRQIYFASSDFSIDIVSFGAYVNKMRGCITGRQCVCVCNMLRWRAEAIFPQLASRKKKWLRSSFKNSICLSEIKWLLLLVTCDWWSHLSMNFHRTSHIALPPHFYAYRVMSRKFFTNKFLSII